MIKCLFLLYTLYICFTYKVGSIKYILTVVRLYLFLLLSNQDIMCYCLNCKTLLEAILKQSDIHCGLNYAKTCLWAYADSKGPDQPAHPHSLIGAFFVSANRTIGYNNMFQWRAKCSYETFRMPRIIWIATFCTCSKALFWLDVAHVLTQTFMCCQSKV